MDSLTAILYFQGVLEQGFKVSVMIGPENSRPHTRNQGDLPANSRLVDFHAAWHKAYNRFYNNRSLRAVKLTSAGRNITKADLRQQCVDAADRLVEELDNWLTSFSFVSVQQSLLTTLTKHSPGPARIILCTDDERLWQLPWHEWSLFKTFQQATISFSQWEDSQIKDFEFKKNSRHVKVLACLAGDAEITTEPDKQYLSEKLHATVLEQCDRIHMGTQLWHDPWDVMVFSGHSRTEGSKGRVFIGSDDKTDDSLTLDELKRTLQKSVSRGLRLVVFNSCQGIGLARQLQGLKVPHIVVMREPIPDVVAHQFLECFFDAFKEGDSLDAAMEVARGQLEKLHYKCPCASWLPVVWQSPATQTLTWEVLKGVEPILPVPEGEDLPIWKGMRGLVLLFLVSLFVTSLVLGIRATGVLQSWELQTYDQLMRWRPTESIDEHIVVVGVTDDDIKTLGEDPLSDQTVLKLLKAIAKFKPRVVGLDIYRDVAVGSESDYAALVNYLIKHKSRNIAVCGYGYEYVQGNAPPQGLTESDVGFANFIVDLDRNVRRHLISTGGDEISKCTTPFSLSFLVALKYLEVQGILPSNIIHKNQEYIQLGDKVIKALPLSSAIGGYNNRVSTGTQIMANYRGGRNVIPEIKIQTILSGEVDPTLMRDKAIFVGYVHHASQDILPTPHGFMPGVVIHAQLASQVISHVMDNRSFIHPVARRFEEVWIWWWIFSFGVVYTLFSSQWRRLIIILISITLLISCCSLLITLGKWITLVPCIFGIFFALILLTAIENIAEQAKIVRSFFSSL